MNKESLRTIFRTVVENRSLLVQLIILAVTALVCSVWIAVAVEPSDVTVYARYSAFGQIHFYKEHWQYLLLFIAYIWVVSLLHAGGMIKFSQAGRPQTAKVILGYTIALLVISLVYVLNILSLGQAA